MQWQLQRREHGTEYTNRLRQWTPPLEKMFRLNCVQIAGQMCQWPQLAIAYLHCSSRQKFCEPNASNKLHDEFTLVQQSSPCLLNLLSSCAPTDRTLTCDTCDPATTSINIGGRFIRRIEDAKFLWQTTLLNPKVLCHPTIKAPG